LSSRYLEFAQDNSAFLLRQMKEEIASGQAGAVAFFAAGVAHRMLGICALLEDADAGAFARSLCLAGQSRLELLQRARKGMEVPAKARCTGKDVFFPASLAGGDLKTAQEIAALSEPARLEEVEYEEDFAFARFLHLKLIAPGDQAALEALLSKWEAALEGEPSGYLEACKALLPGADPASFHPAFLALIEHRQVQLADYAKGAGADQEQLATEGKVFVEGLAVLRLAEMARLPSAPRYPLIPPLSRVPLGGAVPQPGEWLR
jgi:hypothetical protein